jgi:hypothetical protein
MSFNNTDHFPVCVAVVVGAAVFSGAAWILAIICYVGAGLQVLGFMGVAQASVFMRKLHPQFWFSTFILSIPYIFLILHRKSQSCIEDTSHYTA